MAEPLSMMSPSGQNSRRNTPQTSPSRSRYYATVEDHDETTTNIFYESQETFETTTTSSPFIDEVTGQLRLKSRSNSPVKNTLLRHHQSPSKSRSQSRSPSKARASPRKALVEISPSKHLTESALRENDAALARGGEGTESSTTRDDSRENKENELLDTPRSNRSHNHHQRAAFDGGDDTCFSSFSEIATDMTRFVRLGESPIRGSGVALGTPSRSSPFRTPQSSRPGTPGTSRGAAAGRSQQRLHLDASPTPRRPFTSSSAFSPASERPQDDQTTQLLEFTGALNYPVNPRRSPTRSGAGGNNDNIAIPHRLRSPTKDGFVAATPAEAKKYANLLDFDLPPAPTPRSVPTVTPHELEAVKADFLSQISTLRASVAGKDAELAALTQAKIEAEQGRAQAAERALALADDKEGLEAEKRGLEARDREMQVLLREVRGEIHALEKERGDLEARVGGCEKRAEDAEARAEAAEGKVRELEEQLQLQLQLQASASALPDSSNSSSSSAVAQEGGDPPATPITNKTIEAACARVAKDLHDLYRDKHNKKIESLRRTYGERWQGKVGALTKDVERLTRDNEELRLELELKTSGRDTTLTRPILPSSSHREEMVDAGTSTAVDPPPDGRAEGLEAELLEAHARNAALGRELELSRRENGELVAAVEQMLELDPSAADAEHGAAAAAAAEISQAASVPSAVQQMQQMQRPGSAASVRSVGAAHERSGSQDAAAAAGKSGMGMGARSGLKAPGAGFGFKRSVSGTSGGRLGLMSSIERMGRGAGGLSSSQQ